MITSVLLVACGDSKEIDGVKVQTYGLYNEKDLKCENVEYSLVGQNIALAIISPYTLVVPAAVVAFELFEPEGKLDESKPVLCK